MDQVSRTFKQDLKEFLTTAKGSVDQLKFDAIRVDVDSLSSDELDRYFSGFIEKEKYLQGVVIFGNNMNYVIYREENRWVTTHDLLDQTDVVWTSLDNQLRKTGNWIDTYSYFMAQKQFEVIKVNDLEPDEHVWRAAQGRETLSSRDMFFNIFRLGGEGKNSDLAALMYRTNELGNRFSRVLQFENPLVSVITGRDELVTPIRTDDTLLIKQFRELIPEIEKTVIKWKNLPQESDTLKNFTFLAANTSFWVAIDTITPILDAKGYAITLSEHDLTRRKSQLDEAYLYGAILFLIFAIAIYLPLYRKRMKSESLKTSELQALTEDRILELIGHGESEHLEFKSSLRWDFREEKVNKILEDVILKSIAAFTNAKGGILMIGVSDDLEILGLEHDFSTLKKQDVDYFELHLRKLINNQYGIRFSNKHILMQFPEFAGKIICVIQVATGDTPVYLKTKNKQGHEVEKFFVRSGNASQEITSLKEITEYINAHFTGNK
jgi:hypothetical protein